MRGAVQASVVNDDDLEIEAELPHRFDRLAHVVRDRMSLVIGRHDNREHGPEKLGSHRKASLL